MFILEVHSFLLLLGGILLYEILLFLFLFISSWTFGCFQFLGVLIELYIGFCEFNGIHC